jgi:hypothetical protein
MMGSELKPKSYLERCNAHLHLPYVCDAIAEYEGFCSTHRHFSSSARAKQKALAAEQEMLRREEAAARNHWSRALLRWSVYAFFGCLLFKIFEWILKAGYVMMWLALES